MFIIDLTEKYIKKMRWYDISLIKTSTLFLTLFLVTVSQPIQNFVLGIQWYWYLIIGLGCLIFPLKKFFSL